MASGSIAPNEATGRGEAAAVGRYGAMGYFFP
jgi:hypothetical protein